MAVTQGQSKVLATAVSTQNLTGRNTRPSASAPTSGSTDVSAQFHFSLNGIPDADFAKRAIAALDARKSDVEALYPTWLMTQ